jgi:LAO/AO transport system kinase
LFVNIEVLKVEVNSHALHLILVSLFKFQAIKMAKKSDDKKSALHVNQGIEQPSSINEKVIAKMKQQKISDLSVSEFVGGILQGNIMILSKAITLIESSLSSHQKIAQEIIEQCLPHSGKSIRVGITGVPGVGKSTFIESLGMNLISKGKKIAVLAIDPSSQRSKGSILGDKTRMEDLANHPNAFIRPSASSGSLGGVARKTNETVILCEAAGFNTIFIETVGVGQSETAVHSMVDFFLLLMLAGAGDELQGIKRGIMEMADMILINKADGDNIQKAKNAKVQYETALHLFPLTESGWTPKVETCSALNHEGIELVWASIQDYVSQSKANGYFDTNRQNQAVQSMMDTIMQKLGDGLFQHKEIKALLDVYKTEILSNKLSAYIASQKILDKYFELIRK